MATPWTAPLNVNGPAFAGENGLVVHFGQGGMGVDRRIDLVRR